MLGERAGAPGNVLRLMFHPEGLRPYVDDWETVARTLVQRAHREATCGVEDEETSRLLDEILSYPGVPAHFGKPDLATPLVPFVPIRFRKDGAAYDYFSTVTTLGTPQDVTLQELRIECFFPANPETERRARREAAGSS